MGEDRVTLGLRQPSTLYGSLELEMQSVNFFVYLRCTECEILCSQQITARNPRSTKPRASCLVTTCTGDGSLRQLATEVITSRSRGRHNAAGGGTHQAARCARWLAPRLDSPTSHVCCSTIWMLPDWPSLLGHRPLSLEATATTRLSHVPNAKTCTATSRQTPRHLVLHSTASSETCRTGKPCGLGLRAGSCLDLIGKKRTLQTCAAEVLSRRPAGRGQRIQLQHSTRQFPSCGWARGCVEFSSF